MKILHTADWHLGKKLDSYNRIEEQALVLQEIVAIADQEQVDVVLVAGDLYDSINPSLDAQALFYKTLKQLAKDGDRPVIAIAGNHDSPDRIDSPDPLAKECGIIFIGKPMADVGCYELAGKMTISKSEPGFIEILLPKHPPLRLIHTAYPSEQRLKTYLGDDKHSGLSDLLQEHWRLLAEKYCDEQGVNVLMTHLFMQAKGGEVLEEPEGEKPLSVGNADLLYTDIVPAAIHYTALGHLHRYHNIGNASAPIIYASAPLAYSFAEAGQDKYVIAINANVHEALSFQKISLQSGRKLYRKMFESIPDCVLWLQEHPNVLVELTIKTEHFLTPQDTKLLHETHDGIVYIIPITKTKVHEATASQQIDLTKDVKGLFIDYFKFKNNGLEPNDELLAIFQEIVTEP